MTAAKKFILVLHRRQHRGFHTWEFIEILDCSLARARLKYPTDEHHLSRGEARRPEGDSMSKEETRAQFYARNAKAGRTVPGGVRR